MRELVREGAGIVWIAGSEDPQVLADVPPARAVRRVDRPPGARRPTAGPSGSADARFAVVAWPTPAWAAQVYPELDGARPPSRARQRPAALRAPRRRTIRPTAGALHAERLAERARRLTAARSARDPADGARHGPAPRAASGHELARWRQRRARPPHHAQHPHRGGVHEPGAAGDLRARSAARGRWRIAGRVIKGIAGEFRRGRLVRIEADGDDDREFLAAYLARDRGAGAPGRARARRQHARASARPAGRTSRRCWTRTPRRTSPSASASATRARPAGRRSNRSGDPPRRR